MCIRDSVRAIIDLLASVIELSVSIVIFFIASPILAVIIIIANIIPIIVRSKYANGVFMIYRADDETRRKFGYTCLLYTSDAADDLLCVDLGGRRINKKKNKKNKNNNTKHDNQQTQNVQLHIKHITHNTTLSVHN